MGNDSRTIAQGIHRTQQRCRSNCQVLSSATASEDNPEKQLPQDPGPTPEPPKSESGYDVRKAAVNDCANSIKDAFIHHSGDIKNTTAYSNWLRTIDDHQRHLETQIQNQVDNAYDAGYKLILRLPEDERGEAASTFADHMDTLGGLASMCHNFLKGLKSHVKSFVKGDFSAIDHAVDAVKEYTPQVLWK